jgi:hypothetical protein
MPKPVEPPPIPKVPAGREERKALMFRATVQDDTLVLQDLFDHAFNFQRSGRDSAPRGTRTSTSPGSQDGEEEKKEEEKRNERCCRVISASDVAKVSMRRAGNAPPAPTDKARGNDIGNRASAQSRCSLQASTVAK